MTAHALMSGLDLHGPFHYVQSSDPGAVGAGLYWLDTGSNVIKLRNPGNTAWVGIAGATGATGATGAAGATGATGAPGVQGVQGIAGNPGAITVSITGGQPYICIRDQKPSGTSSGTFTAGAWQTRQLNTFVCNDLNLATLASNQITLPAGTWRCRISAVGSQVNDHQARLRSITGAGTILVGTSEHSASNAVWATSRSEIIGNFPLMASAVLEVQHQSSTTGTTDGFGRAVSFGEVEVYTVAEFWLVGGPPPFFGSTFPNPSFDVLRRQNTVARMAR